MSPVCGFELSPRPSLPAGFELSPRPSLPAGRDFGPVRTCGAFPPTAARRAPPVHEATGGYAVRSPCPSGIPRPRHNASPLGLEGLPCFDLLAASIRKSGLEIENRCTDCPCFDLFAASIRKSGPEIKNRCTDCPCFDLFAASIRKSGPEIGNRCKDCPCFDLLAALIRKFGLEIKNRCTDLPEIGSKAASIRKSWLEIENRCSAIVPASRMARLQRSLPLRCRVRFQFSSQQSRTVPPAAPSCRQVERPACSAVVRCRRGQYATKAA